MTGRQPEQGENAMIGIAEAADSLGLEPHILNFWESLFPEISPCVKSGRRYYDAANMELIRLVYQSLIVDNSSVGSTRKKLGRLQRRHGGAETTEQPGDRSDGDVLSFDAARRVRLRKILFRLEQIKDQLDKSIDEL